MPPKKLSLEGHVSSRFDKDGREQKVFPSRTAKRRSAGTRSSLKRLTSEERRKQATFTQHYADWRSTPSNSNECIITPSDDEDEYFEQPQSKKKRRTSKGPKRKGLERGQSTLTQNELLDLGRTARSRLRDEAEDFDIYDEDGKDRYVEKLGQQQKERANRIPFLRQGSSAARQDSGIDRLAKMVEDVETQTQARVPEIAESSQTDTTSAAKAKTRLVDYQTPRKVRFMEVPSSETPPSIKLSTRRSHRTPLAKELQRSPLKERSTNVPTKRTAQRSAKEALSPFNERYTEQSPQKDVHPSPENQNKAMKMLEAVRFRQRGMAPPPRRLKRVTTIQESQQEDEEPQIEEAVNDMLPPPRKLKRVTTVQDSQYDDADLETQDYHHAVRSAEAGSAEEVAECTVGEDELDEAEIEDADYIGYDDPETCDPANSALDRDAARAWLETQTQRQLYSAIGSDVEGEDDRYNDSGGYAANVIQQPALPSQELGEISTPPLLSDDTLPSEEVDPHSDTVDWAEVKRPALPDKLSFDNLEKHVSNSTKDSGDEELVLNSQHRDQERRALVGLSSSSSPPLRPSQISTVVPTQASPQTSPIDLPKALPTVQSNKRNKLETQRTLPPQSSSPFPMPPQTLDTQSFVRPQKGGIVQAETLSSDSFALPPSLQPSSPQRTVTTQALSSSPLPLPPKTQDESLLPHRDMDPSSPSLPPQLFSHVGTNTFLTRTISSSSIPLPPWDTQDRLGRARQSSPVWASQKKKAGKIGQDSDFDWSLPPPPPLSSGSVRGTPGSSAR